MALPHSHAPLLLPRPASHPPGEAKGTGRGRRARGSWKVGGLGQVTQVIIKGLSPKSRLLLLTEHLLQCNI